MNEVLVVDVVDLLSLDDLILFQELHRHELPSPLILGHSNLPKAT